MFSKVKSLTTIKLLLHVLIYFFLQLGNFLRNYFGVVYCHCFSYVKKKFIATYLIRCDFESCVTLMSFVLLEGH